MTNLISVRLLENHLFVRNETNSEVDIQMPTPDGTKKTYLRPYEEKEVCALRPDNGAIFTARALGNVLFARNPGETDIAVNCDIANQLRGGTESCFQVKLRGEEEKEVLRVEARMLPERRAGGGGR